VQDDEGCWWVKSGNTGEWHYHDGSAWVEGTPLSYQSPRTLPEKSVPHRHSQHKQKERLPLPPTTLPESTSTPNQNRGNQHRGVPSWINLGAWLIGVALLGVSAVLWILMPYGATYLHGHTGGPSPEEDPKPAPGYELVEADSGKLSVEVPSGWSDVTIGGASATGEKGSNWPSFLGERISASITAVNDRNTWSSGARGHKGMYVVASKKLAQRYTDDDLVTSGPNDYSSSCEAGTPRNFERPPYSGRILEWQNCSGESDHTALTLAAAPENRECVVLLQIGGYLQGDEESVQHVLDTFNADCGAID
jgi:hypothetical protein